MMKKEKNKLIPGWLSVVVFCSSIAVIIFALILISKNDMLSQQENGTLSEEIVIQNDSNSIAIPGYELLEFYADSRIQTLCLSNPAQNACFFQISLRLGETLLWKSDLIEPGKTSEPILLTQVLKKGTYTNAVLKYECFQMDGKTPLNGAETKITLWVK